MADVGLTPTRFNPKTHCELNLYTENKTLTKWQSPQNQKLEALKNCTDNIDCFDKHAKATTQSKWIAKQ